MKKFEVPTSQGLGVLEAVGRYSGVSEHLPELQHLPTPKPGKTSPQRQTQTREPLAWPSHLAEAARLFWKECGFNQRLPSAR